MGRRFDAVYHVLTELAVVPILLCCRLFCTWAVSGRSGLGFADWNHLQTAAQAASSTAANSED